MTPAATQLRQVRSDCVPPAWAKSIRSATFVSETVTDAGPMSADEFHREVVDAYRRLFAKVAAARSPFLVRAWNFVPRIHDDAGEGRDRYMIFNAARFEAMSAAFGDAAKIAERAPAATGVGCRGDDFSLHALAMSTKGEPIDNPRQTPAYRYSTRYGPRPPCFARATRVVIDGETKLLVAGTAAIRGEDSRYVDSIERQFDLTIDNLRFVSSGGTDAFESIRAYVPRESDEAFVAARCREHFPAAEIEIVSAELCRRELLVEIEGVAKITT